MSLDRSSALTFHEKKDMEYKQNTQEEQEMVITGASTANVKV